MKFRVAILLLTAGLARADTGSIVTLPGGDKHGSVQVNRNGQFYADTSLVYSTSTHVLSAPIVNFNSLSSNGASWRFPSTHVGGGSLIDDGAGNLTVGTPSVIAISSGSNISVFSGGVQISTALGRMVMNANQFRATLSGGTTVAFALDPSSVTLLGQTIDIGANSNLAANSPLILTGSSMRVDTSSVTLLGPKINLAGTGVTGVLPAANLLASVVYSNTTQTIDGVKTISSSLTVTNTAGIITTQVVAGTITATSGIIASSITLNGPMGLTYLTARGPQVSTVTFGLVVGSMTVGGQTNGQSFAFIGAAVSSVTYGMAVGSMTVTGADILDFANRAAPAGQVGASTIYGSSVTEMLHENPNNEGDFSIVISSVNPIPGHIVKFSSRAKLIDGGFDNGVIIPSTFTWILNFPLVANAVVTIQGGSMTIVAPGLSIIHVATETVSQEYYDVHLSTTDLGYVYTNTAKGTSGYLITSAGPNQPVAWSPPGCLPLTKAQIQAITPSKLGECYFCTNCTSAINCTSSGTATADQFFGLDRTSACQ